jgi:hypothetical protein
MMDYTDSQEYYDLDERFIEAFGENIPLMMIPPTETFAELAEKVNKSIETGKNLLPEYYDWKNDGSEIY